MSPEMLEELKTSASAAARTHQLPPALVLAVCAVESSWIPTATRFEKAYRWLYMPERYVTDSHDLETETREQMTSWGLMQIMGANARSLGYTDESLENLIKIPALGLEFACRYMHRLAIQHLEKWGWQGVVRAWNTGRPRDTPAGLSYQFKVGTALKGAWDDLPGRSG